ASLSRPGGNVTGVSFVLPELSRKFPELLREALPRLSRLGVLDDPTYPGRGPTLQAIEATANTLGLKVEVGEARDSVEIESAFAQLKKNRVEAIVVTNNGVNFAHRARIIELTAASRLPALYASNEYVRDGGLLSYGVDFLALSRRAVDYVDKIFRGAKP